ncbi:MAG: oligoribonuclease [Acidimicrobiia bacterium]
MTQMSGIAVDGNRLVWIDLEMTGLDVRRHVIVEIAVLVTDAGLEPLDEGLDLVVHQPEEALAAMDEVVRAMHARSGLLTEIAAATLTLADAGARALAYVRQHVPAPRTAPVCGNSIGVDRRFLDAYLPELDGYLHYRSVDVSTLKELCRRWAPDAYRKRPAKQESHRALTDVRESIAELAYYRDAFLRVPVVEAHEAVEARAVEDADGG